MRRLSSVLMITFLALFGCGREQPAGRDGGAAPAVTSGEPVTPVQYTGIDPRVFQPAPVIEQWIADNDTAAITAHAWALWQAMTAPSGQTLNGTPLPIWETWYDSTEVYLAAPGSGPQPNPNLTQLTQSGGRRADSKGISKRRFHLPNQFFEQGSTKARGDSTGNDQIAAVVFTFNRFTQEMKDHVAANQYYNANTLNTLNGWPAGTAIENRTILPFPSTSMMLKPVFFFISGTEPTPVPYWNGTGSEATKNSNYPTPGTWKQCVLADPTGKATNDQPITCNGISLPAGSYRVVPVSATNPSQSAFYAITLTDVDIAELATLVNQNETPAPPNTLKAGDLAIFVASHVSSREIPNWTWQTFWWQPDPANLASEPPNASSPPGSIGKPWNQYAACTAYMMVTPDNQPLRCYNPYLETTLGINAPPPPTPTPLYNEPQTDDSFPGITTNCMTCHRAAAWPTNKYATAFDLEPNDAIWFSSNTKTDFAWSMVNFAHDPPFIPPPPGTGANVAGPARGRPVPAPREPGVAPPPGGRTATAAPPEQRP